jgi:hypothetical protein
MMLVGDLELNDGYHPVSFRTPLVHCDGTAPDGDLGKKMLQGRVVDAEFIFGTSSFVGSVAENTRWCDAHEEKYVVPR